MLTSGNSEEMVNKTRKMVPREIGYVDFEGMTAVEIIEYLNHKIDGYGKDIYVDKVYGSYGSSDYLALHEKVLETDAQYEARVREEERQENDRRKYDLQQLERLQKLYGTTQA
jgi:hypothetical protein